MLQTAERVSHKDLSDNYVFQRSLLAYVEAAKLVSGRVLEIGTGSGYGIDAVSPNVTEFITIDKFEDVSVLEHIKTLPNIKFMQMDVPPLTGLADNSFDFVITFQVIEHIQDDNKFVSEIHRVLKPGGKFIVTTPNIKMSITRNPWHIREYTIAELDQLLKKSFSAVQKRGVAGNEKIMEYYRKNIDRLKKLHVLIFSNCSIVYLANFCKSQHDILNRMNRRKLLQSIFFESPRSKWNNYRVQEATDDCFDLFYVAVK